MKLSLIKILSAFLIMSCNDQSQNQSKSQSIAEKPAHQTAINADTTFTIWELESDTTITSQDIQIDNDFYQIRTITYSLNDSSVKWTNNSGTSVFVDTYHNHQSDIYLIGENDTVLSTSLTKEIFRDSLNPEFYQRAIIWNVEYESVRSNRLYFTAQLLVPDTDWGMKGMFAVFFRTDKKGQVDFWGLENID